MDSNAAQIGLQCTQHRAAGLELVLNRPGLPSSLAPYLYPQRHSQRSARGAWAARPPADSRAACVSVQHAREAPFVACGQRGAAMREDGMRDGVCAERVLWSDPCPEKAFRRARKGGSHAQEDARARRRHRVDERVFIRRRRALIARRIGKDPGAWRKTRGEPSQPARG